MAEDKKSIVKVLINEFENSQNSINESDLKNVLNSWKSLKKEWNEHYKDDSLLDIYTNIKGGEVKTYLTHFLERGSSVFGYSRPGTSMQLMVYKELTKGKNEESYYVENDNKNENKKTGKSRKVALDYFVNNVKEVINDLINFKDFNAASLIELDKKCNNGNFNKYQAKQVLRKIIVLNASEEQDNKKDVFPLLHIYQEDKIDKWYDIFKDEEKEDSSQRKEDPSKVGFFYKSNFVAQKIYDELNKELHDLPKDAKTFAVISNILFSLKSPIKITPSSPNVILYGPPGTGKTYSVKKMLDYENVDKKNYCFVQFHPNYAYEDFIEGIKPCGITSTGQLEFKIVNGEFKQFCIKAKNKPNETFYFVIDEINRANLNSVLGEALSLLEADYRDCPDDRNKEKNLCSTPQCSLAESIISQDIKKYGKKVDDWRIKPEDCYFLKIDGHQVNSSKEIQSIELNENTEVSVKFGIPNNIYFIGMMNDVDKSIDTFDLALRRRFCWIRMDFDEDSLKHILTKRISALRATDGKASEGLRSDDYTDIDSYIEQCKSLNSYIADPNQGLGLGNSYKFGHAFFSKILSVNGNNSKGKNSYFNKSASKKLFDEFLRPTLKEYLRAFYSTENEIESKLNDAKEIFCSEKGTKYNGE